MRKNRITFILLWMFLIILLILFPGFEWRCFVLGLLPGCPVFLLFPGYSWILFKISVALILSGAFMAICSWLMDRAGTYRRFLALILFLMVISACFFSTGTISYDGWKNHPVNAGVEDRITYRDYERSFLIPATLAGAMFGLYAGTAACAAVSLVISFYGKRLTRR